MRKRDSPYASRYSNNTNETNGETQSFDQIETRITTFINVIERFESDEKKLLKHEFDQFVKSCNETSKTIEEALKRELMKPEDDNKSLILRYQKIMNEQKKKLKNLNLKKNEYIVEEVKVDKRDTEEEEDESMAFLNQEAEGVEDFVYRREQQIIKIHRDITMVNQISEEISILIQTHGGEVQKIDTNMEKANEKLKQANKELLKHGEKASFNKKKYLKLMAYMLGFIFVLMIFVHYK